MTLFRWHASFGVWCFLGAACAALALRKRVHQHDPRWVSTHRAVLILSMAVAVLSFFVRMSTCEVFDRSARSIGLRERSVTLAYLAELIHVMPYWPRERYLELAPFRWKQTRARLDSAELRREVGPVTVPPPFSDSAEQAPPS